MRRLTSLLFATCLALALPIALRGEAMPATAPGEWISLFDGKTLDGWRGYRQADASATRWRVQDGLLTLPPREAAGTQRSRDIITTDTFDRFELEFEWRVSPGGNSGVKYFVLEDMDGAIGHEYQIIDDAQHADATLGAHRRTAAFYDVLPAALPADGGVLKPAGEWNRGRIRVAPDRAGAPGTRVYHYVNDVQVLEYELDSPGLRAAIQKSKFKDVARFGKLQKGHILLQDHGDQVWYRNVRIQRLSGT